VPIVQPPQPGPFGRMFSFVDPDGYTITVHGVNKQGLFLHGKENK
jgi:predicted enzyme related to lactoylglutathione lyase